MKERLAEHLGGAPDDHHKLGLGLVILYHGASTLLLGEGVHPHTADAIKEACLAAVDALVARASETNPPKPAASRPD